MANAIGSEHLKTIQNPTLRLVGGAFEPQDSSKCHANHDLRKLREMTWSRNLPIGRNNDSLEDLAVEMSYRCWGPNAQYHSLSSTAQRWLKDHCLSIEERAIYLLRVRFTTSNLSLKSKALLLMMIEAGKHVVISDMVSQCLEGKATVYAAINELIQNGYLHRRWIRGGGKVRRCEWIVFVTPQPQDFDLDEYLLFEDEWEMRFDGTEEMPYHIDNNPVDIKPGYVYVLRIDGKLIKVGSTSNIAARLQNYRSKHQLVELILAVESESCLRLEIETCEWLRPYLKNKVEWFANVPDAMIEWLKTVKKEADLQLFPTFPLYAKVEDRPQKSAPSFPQGSFPPTPPISPNPLSPPEKTLFAENDNPAMNEEKTVPDFKLNGEKAKAKRQREANPMFDFVAAFFFENNVCSTTAPQISKLAKQFTELGATDNEIRTRWERMQAAWGRKFYVGPHTLVNRWGMFKDPLPETPGIDPKLAARRAGQPDAVIDLL